MAPGERNKFGVPMFEPKVFGINVGYCIEQSTCDIVKIFRRPYDLATGALFPFVLSVRSWSCGLVFWKGTERLGNCWDDHSSTYKERQERMYLTTGTFLSLAFLVRYCICEVS